jgi:hypothetical protein
VLIAATAAAKATTRWFAILSALPPAWRWLSRDK